MDCEMEMGRMGGNVQVRSNMFKAIHEMDILDVSNVFYESGCDVRNV